MIELDKDIKYNIDNATDEQMKEVLEYLKQIDKNWTHITKQGMLHFIDDAWYRSNKPNGDCCITTLFEPQLKIGDTFERDGFICRVESKVAKWYYNIELKCYFKSSNSMNINHPEITDQEFINQLEKFSK